MKACSGRMSSPNDWFTIERLDDRTFAISEYRHWEQTHCYLLLGAHRAALIDTGLGVANIREAVEDLTDLPVRVLTTHGHWDHIGGHGLFSEISIHAAEADWLSGKFPLPLDAVKENLLREPCEFPESFAMKDYYLYQRGAKTLLHDGDRIDLGDRTLQVVHTPGHSPGHCCFYEPERQYLYAGDLIYAGCLYAFYPTTDPVLFYQSLKRVAQLPVRKILPGHRRLDIPVSLRADILAGFAELEAKGMLRQGSGVVEFEGFQIHI